MTLPGFHECPECWGEGLKDTYTELQHWVVKRCPECGGAGQEPTVDTIDLVADAWKQATGGPTVNWAAARAALLAYARHTQETNP